MNQVMRFILLGSLIILQCIFICTNLSCAKSQKPVINHPESVVFDTQHDRYLISNVAGKNILALDKNNQLTLFASNLAGPKGLVIRGENLYATDVNSVRAFSLKDGKLLWNLPLAKSQFLNDAEVDNTHYLYISDSDANCIYRIDLDTRAVEVFRDAALIKPNGILYDTSNQRLIIVSQRENSPIQALYWDKQKIETLMTTPFSGLDGLTRDKSGNYYFTSWGAKAVFRVSSDFRQEPVLIKDGYNGPADISYNPKTNTLVLPVMMEDRIDMIGIK